jgi:hypothetical protein
MGALPWADIGIVLGGAGVGAVGGALAGYALGLRRDRAQFAYEQRTRAVTAIRNKINALQQDLLTWAAPTMRRLDEDSDRLEHGRQILRKLDAMEAYFEAQRPWLEPRTQDLYDRIATEFKMRVIPLQGVLETQGVAEVQPVDPEDPYDADVYGWALQRTPGLPDLQRRWDAEVERIIAGSPGLL